MKKFYTSPEIEIKVFATEDIITASAPSTGMDTNPGTPSVDVEGGVPGIDYGDFTE